MKQCDFASGIVQNWGLIPMMPPNTPGVLHGRSGKTDFVATLIKK